MAHGRERIFFSIKAQVVMLIFFLAKIMVLKPLLHRNCGDVVGHEASLSALMRKLQKTVRVRLHAAKRNAIQTYVQSQVFSSTQKMHCQKKPDGKAKNVTPFIFITIVLHGKHSGCTRWCCFADRSYCRRHDVLYPAQLQT